MVQAPVEKLSLEAFLAMPETKPASEYIDGEVVQKPKPKPKHSRLQSKLSMSINEVLELREAAFAFTELKCTFGGRSIVPDISVVVWERLLLNEEGELADEFEACPDWVIEILSPGQGYTRVWNKVLHAMDHGAQMGWLIDSRERSILTCAAGEHPQLFMEADQRLAVPAFAEAIKLTQGEVFGWLAMGRGAAG
ncbi:MAG: Uma2 family endonuclease [Cyanobacteria bacterium J06614_10]